MTTSRGSPHWRDVLTDLSSRGSLSGFKRKTRPQIIRAWSPVLLPGLLQTGDYARALFIAAGADDDYADEQVSVRIGRQEILDRLHPPHLVTVFDESVLQRLIGSPQIMHDALIRVAELSQRPNIVVQVVPAAKGANAGLSGTFDLATAADGTTTLRMDGTLAEVQLQRQRW